MSDRKRDHIIFLEDIVRCIEKIEDYTRDVPLDRLSEHSMVADAVIRNFEVIGEAVKHVPKAVRARHPEVEWKEAAGLRDVLIHEYFGVDLEAVKDTVERNLPSFKAHITKVLDAERERSKSKVKEGR